MSLSKRLLQLVHLLEGSNNNDRIGIGAVQEGSILYLWPGVASGCEKEMRRYLRSGSGVMCTDSDYANTMVYHLAAAAATSTSPRMRKSPLKLYN